MLLYNFAREATTLSKKNFRCFHQSHRMSKSANNISLHLRLSVINDQIRRSNKM